MPNQTARKHRVAATLTEAVDKIGGGRELRSVVDEIAKLELEQVVGWRWWWYGIPAPDGIAVNVYVTPAQAAALASQLATNNYLQTIFLKHIGVPVPELFSATFALAPPGAAAAGVAQEL